MITNRDINEYFRQKAVRDAKRRGRETPSELEEEFYSALARAIQCTSIRTLRFLATKKIITN